MTRSNKTEAVALALRELLDRNSRTGSLFGVAPGTVHIRDRVDLVTAGIGDEIDAETGAELHQ